MNKFIADELATKVLRLTKALESANDLINKLEEENTNLKYMLSLLETSENIEDCESWYDNKSIC